MAELCKAKGAILDLDDVLFPTSEYVFSVLESAVGAMIEAGLPVKQDEGLESLMTIRKKLGSNNQNHFDALCVHYGLDPAPQRIVQAGVSAYHSAREKLLVPQPETIDFMDFLKDTHYRISIVTAGNEKKQWFKIHRLGLAKYVKTDGSSNPSSYNVYIWRDEKNKLNGKKRLIKNAIVNLDLDKNNSFAVGDRPYDCAAAKMVGIRYAFRMMSGSHIFEQYEPWVKEKHKHDFEVASLKDIIYYLGETEILNETNR